MARTLLDKVWEAHSVRTLPSGQTQLLIGLHLIHEVTTPQAFQMLKELKLKVRMPERTFGTLDHIIPTTDQTRPYADPMAEDMAAHMYKNMKDFGLNLFDMSTGKQGIVHVIGPELGLTQPGMTIACGDSHTSTHGAVGAIAFGIGTTQVRDVLATQCLSMAKPKLRQVRVDGALAKGVYAKDVILAIINQLGVKGGVGYAYEYAGPVIERMTMEERLTVCNMSHRGRRALRLRQSRRHHHRLSPRQAPRAAGRGLRPRGRVVEVRRHRAGAPRSTTSSASTARRSSPSSPGASTPRCPSAWASASRAPDSKPEAERAHLSRGARPHGLRGGAGHQGHEDRRGLRGLVHQRAAVGSPHRRRGGQEGQGGQARARPHRARLAAGGQGRRGRGPARDLPGRGLSSGARPAAPCASA